MKGFLAWMWISRPDKTLLITRKTFLIIRSDAGGLRPPYIIYIYNIYIYIYNIKYEYAKIDKCGIDGARYQ